MPCRSGADMELCANFALCGFDTGGLAWTKLLGSIQSRLTQGARGWAGGSRVPPGCSELLRALQEEHAEEQAGGHGQEEVQHGSQEGTVGMAWQGALCSPAHLVMGWALGSATPQSRCLAAHRAWGRARARAGAGQAMGRVVGSAASCGAASLAPLQGIQFLIENDLLKNTCEDIAQFLYKGEGLNKTAIGDYLGERYAGPRWLRAPEGALGSHSLRDGALGAYRAAEGGTQGWAP